MSNDTLDLNHTMQLLSLHMKFYDRYIPELVH